MQFLPVMEIRKDLKVAVWKFVEDRFLVQRALELQPGFHGFSHAQREGRLSELWPIRIPCSPEPGNNDNYYELLCRASSATVLTWNFPREEARSCHQKEKKKRGWLFPWILGSSWLSFRNYRILTEAKEL